ncbi:neuromedin-U receptor 1-like [Wyeomyia smithii]|uniref:neuromedin-U receptor 1-like n=1 Tax=Wyeomyia smithii TaxID=174621 RepID=UPI002467F491|nr:neuromedin-U receptor 1-like [Wyeomyia smithii]XP_055526037.1 neuromedin-U receptor 1-like [Wyeomyia smithii]XP_055526038.1 neuromedin-U receptor 1-like [Wyeomyia smithii]XP_055526039.1 neuromedin-U receptor 1-like [Wyeomyia smithii]XP_055526040.1 neuromedin-U receptor 1-like [Wyeomyia smithii]
MMELQLSVGASTTAATTTTTILNHSLLYLELFAVSSTSSSLHGSGNSATTILAGFDLLNPSPSSGSGDALLLSDPPVKINDTGGSDTGGQSQLANENFNTKADPICIILPITIFYCFIFVAGILGNLAICIVIAKNRSMHTATNYYLFNLAVSDFLLLLFGMPLEVYGTWYPFAYPFNQVACIITGLLSETATNATVLTITSFTVERYIAICHPFRSHTMSKLSRAIKFVIAIWLVAFGLATPQALQFGVVENGNSRLCTIKNRHFEHAFEVSSFLFFVGPMTVIAVLYVLIGIKLRKSKLLQGVKRQGIGTGAGSGTTNGGGDVISSGGIGTRSVSGQTRVIRMLVAVVATFFFCWAPFHAQRLMAVYGAVTNTNNVFFFRVYIVLTYISGILYFLSTCINPLLYHIMSHKFRDASRRTLKLGCYGTEPKRPEKVNHRYSALSRYGVTGNGGSFHTTSNLTYGGANLHPTKRAKSELQFSQQETEMILLRSAPSQHRNSEGQFPSTGSQSTIITNLSVCGRARSTSIEKRQSNGRANHRSGDNIRVLGASGGTANSDSGGRLATIAEKLRRGTQRVLQFNKSPIASPSKEEPTPASIDELQGKRRALKKKTSEDSVDTNTISNSSLQEFDEEEFSSAELARFMGEINKEIR